MARKNTVKFTHGCSMREKGKEEDSKNPENNSFKEETSK